MALIFCDGFDHYGTDETNMTDGAYAEVDGSSSEWTLSSTNPRTGTYSMRRGTSTTAKLVRRVLGGAKTTVGQAIGLYMSQLPIANDGYVIYDFRDAANVPQISIGVQSTGTIVVKRGYINSGTTLYTTPSPAVVAEAYQHVETWAYFHQTLGTVEVRVNGVTVVSLSNIDTVATSNVECSQVALCCNTNKTVGGTTTDVISDVDDYFCCDDSGSYNNDFVGDRRVLTLMPNADTAQADWSLSTGVDGYALIDDVAPDDDSTYIYTGAPGSPGPVSEFDLDDLPGGVASISGVVVVNRSRKTDAGIANLQLGVVSGSSEAIGSDRAITEAYTYYHDVVETDPDTAAPFTPTAVDALKIKIERTA